jgi:hypothetical protein
MVWISMTVILSGVVVVIGLRLPLSPVDEVQVTFQMIEIDPW